MNNYRQIVDKLKTTKDLYISQKKEKESIVDEKKDNVENLIKAKYILNTVALQTQKQFTDYVQDLVTYIIRSVYVDRDLKFVMRFEIKGGKSQCNLMVQEGDEEPFFPETEQGGGLLDVISFALRLVMWSLSDPKPRNLLWLDEPMKFLGEEGDLLQRMITVMKKLAQEIPMQMIIATHIPALADMADRAWIFTHDGVKCTVKQVVDAFPFKIIPIAEDEIPMLLKRN
jgi:hypothetical protein